MSNRKKNILRISKKSIERTDVMQLIISEKPSTAKTIAAVVGANEKEYDGLATLDGKYIQVRQGENWGIFDLSENKEIIPCQYFHGEKQSGYSVHFCPDFMIKPNEELILVLNDGLWGYINKSNNLVIDCIYAILS